MTPVICIAIAVFLEARGEGPDGMLAVADVVMERVKDPRWPDDPCSVVQQPRQFAFSQDIVVSGGDVSAWIEAVAVAQTVISGGGLGLGATHFHNDSEMPYWTKNATLVGRWGDHLFWREN